MSSDRQNFSLLVAVHDCELVYVLIHLVVVKINLLYFSSFTQKYTDTQLTHTHKKHTCMQTDRYHTRTGIHTHDTHIPNLHIHIYIQAIGVSFILG